MIGDEAKLIGESIYSEDNSFKEGFHKPQAQIGYG